MKKLTILLLVLLAAACSNRENKEDRKHTISVSILPEKYFLEQVAGDMFDINVMIPPGSSPATYEPTPAQLASLTRADLYFKMGYTGFELAWMDKISAANNTMKIVDLSQGIDLIREGNMHGDHNQQEAIDQDHHHGGIDPHTWLSPKNVKIIAAHIRDALVAQYPSDKTRFEENYNSFAMRIDSLDQAIREMLAENSVTTFFTYHPSLSYFARDYNLEQIPLELMGKSPSASYLKELVDTGKEKQIGVVFLQMQFDQHNAEVLAKEIGAEIVQINPLDPDWYNQMLFIAGKLTKNQP